MAKSVRYEGEREGKRAEKDTVELFRMAQYALGQPQPQSAAPQATEIDGLVKKVPVAPEVPEMPKDIEAGELADLSMAQHDAAIGKRPPLTQEETQRLHDLEVALGESNDQRKSGESGKV